jgi:ethanolamine ammonia-lyase small subunit
LTIVLQGRVAIGNEIGAALGARQVAVLIGERPGRTDAERNCISNVRGEGISYSLAARKLHFLME